MLKYAAIVAFPLIAATIVLILRNRQAARVRAAKMEKQRMAEATARRHAQVIQESKKIIAQARNPEIIASRFDVIRDHAEQLSALAEHNDLPDLPDAQPQDLKAFYRNKKDQVLHDRIIEQIDDALAKAGAAPKRTAKITCLEKALLLVMEGKRTMRDEALLKELEARGRNIQEAIGLAMQMEAD